MKKILLAFFCITLFPVASYSALARAEYVKNENATQAAIAKEENALIAKLNKTKGAGRLVILDSLSNLYWNVPKEGYWLKRYYDECLTFDSLSLAESSLSGLATYYHNSDSINQLRWCAEQGDMLAKKLGRYSDDYFSIKSFLCKRYLWDNNYNEAISSAQQLLNLAIEHRSIGGQEIGEELMGSIYQLMNLNSQALSHYNAAYQLLVRYTPNGFRSIAQLTTSMIEVNLETNRLKDAYALISSFEAIQADVLKGKYGKQPGFPVARNNRLASIYFADYYFRSNNLAKMSQCLANAAKIKQSDVYVDFLFNYESAKYNEAVKNYSLALSCIDKVIEVDGGESVEYRNFRANLFQKMGRLKDAANEYQICIKLLFASRDSFFNKQVAGLQHFQDTKLMELRLKDKELRIKKMQNTELIAAVIFFLVLSLILGLFLDRNRRLGIALKKNNERLANEDELLKFAIKKSNEADRLKTSFLHSVSHEVRTPLNAIVGFSNLIAEDDSYKKYDVKECSQQIAKNSTALLELMDKILKISQYETSVANIDSKKISSCDVTSVCYSALDKLKKSGKLKDGVELVFKGVPADYILNTNENFLEQMLNNLLDNAAKNTETGSITLAYELSSNSKSLVFSVTDTGCGIEDSERSKIFDEFEKGNSFAQGLGLGLVMCKIIASNLGGKILLDDFYRDGCKFIFTHPTDLKTSYEQK